jgi:hypothetical protein
MIDYCRPVSFSFYTCRQISSLNLLYNTAHSSFQCLTIAFSFRTIGANEREMNYAARDASRESQL